MTTLADYIVLRDQPFVLEPGERRELSCDLPGDLAEVPLIIAYKAQALSSPPLGAGATLTIRPRHATGTIESVELRDGGVHGLWETFSANKASTVLKNIFEFTAETGRVRISDVILWFQRSGPAPVRTNGARS